MQIYEFDDIKKLIDFDKKTGIILIDQKFGGIEDNVEL